MTATSVFKIALTAVGAFGLLVEIGAGAASDQTLTADSPPPRAAPAAKSTVAPAADLQTVLDAQAALGMKPVETLTPAEARRQPTLAQAAARVLKAQGRPAALSDAGVTIKDLSYGGDPAYKARVYIPVDIPRKPKPPLVVYYPDGGWVTGDLDAFDATPRFLAIQLNAVVISLEYRHAPEHGFGSQQADAAFAYDWAMKTGAEAGADRGKVLIVGEGAGASLAITTAVRDFLAAAKVRPKAVLVIDPWVTGGQTTPSKTLYAGAKPLNTAMLGWYAHYAAPVPADPAWDLTKAELHVLPHVVIVNAEIDPLRDDGAALEQALKSVGVRVDRQAFPGMTHGFFGLEALVRGAYDANVWALAAVRPDLDIHDADYHGGFGRKKPAADAK